MPINVVCQCGKSFQVSRNKMGEVFECPKCGEEVEVLDPDAPPPPRRINPPAAAPGAARKGKPTTPEEWAVEYLKRIDSKLWQVCAMLALPYLLLFGWLALRIVFGE